MSGQIWNFKGCNFGSRRQEAAASVKRQKVDAYESGSTEFHEERWCDNATWPGWISLRMALKIRYPMDPHGTHWRIIIPIGNFWCPIFTHWYLTEFEMPGTLAMRCPRRAIAQQNREEEARLKAGGFAERCSVAVKDLWKDAVLILTLKECSWLVQHVHLAKGQEMDFIWFHVSKPKGQGGHGIAQICVSFGRSFGPSRADMPTYLFEGADEVSQGKHSISTGRDIESLFVRTVSSWGFLLSRYEAPKPRYRLIKTDWQLTLVFN